MSYADKERNRERSEMHEVKKNIAVGVLLFGKENNISLDLIEFTENYKKESEKFALAFE